MDEKLASFDDESAELLRRVTAVWVNVKECLDRSDNADTEEEVSFHSTSLNAKTHFLPRGLVLHASAVRCARGSSRRIEEPF